MREEILDSVLEMIGSTPLVRVRRMYVRAGVEILAKIEGCNPLGSVKERIALFMIESAEGSGALKPGMTILESSSGNTGIGLAMVAAVKGYPCVTVMPASATIERRKILHALGARVVLTSPEEGSDGAWRKADEMKRLDPARYFRCSQYESPDNPRAHREGTAEEIWRACRGELDAFVATLGTCGTIVGAGKRLKQLDRRIRIVSVEPQPGHKQPGLRNMKESRTPPIMDWSVVDERIFVSDAEAIAAARALARQEGIFAGVSSGTAMVGAMRTAEILGKGRIVALLPDRGEKYLSTPLFDLPEGS